MGFDEGRIVLNCDNATYFPGQMLSGRLEFNLEKDKKFRGIYAEVRGKCKVHWTTSHTRRVNDRTEHYTVTHESYEEYMNTTIYLIGSKSGEQTLHPGRHVFPFECQIPPHCPSSFEGSEGNIRYSVKVTVDRAFKIDQTKVAAFRVEAPVDLNTNPYCREPIAFEFEQTFCCWCMNSGLTETLVKLPAGGFCPRQIIPIEVACNNNSNVEIDKIRFKIKKSVTFEATHEPDTRTEESEIAELSKGPIPAHTTRNWTVEMEVPDVDVPNLNNCRFINIDYRFKVDIETSGCHTDEDQSRKIFLGTIPLASLQYPPNSNFESAQNTQAVTSNYPPPIINQPGPNPPYPGVNSSYPGANPPYAGANPPYAGANPPYAGANPPYPGANPPYPGANPPYPGNTPNMGFNVSENPPYPAVTSLPAPSPFPVGSDPPYPNNSNLPVVTTQHVSSSAPYPTNGRSSPFNPNVGSLPYPTQNPSDKGPGFPATSPYPASTPYSPGKPDVSGLKTSNLGLTAGGPNESMPLLPPSAMPASPSPYATASAPPPSTPDEEGLKPATNVTPYPK